MNSDELIGSASWNIRNGPLKKLVDFYNTERICKKVFTAAENFTCNYLHLATVTYKTLDGC